MTDARKERISTPTPIYSSGGQLTFPDAFEITREDYVRYAREVAERLCRERGSVTVDDIREVAGVPSSYDARVLGAILRPPRFQLLRYERGTRSESHRRAVGRFVLA